MILEFKCKNFRSIGDEIFFSMLASNDDTNKTFSFINYNDTNILKKAIIYGSNGAGKSNFVRALMFLKSLVVNSQNHMPNNKIFAQPHKMFQSDPTLFSIHFVDKKGNRYFYNFKFNENEIINEELYHYPNGKQSKIFIRDGDNVDSSQIYKSQFSFVKSQALKPNRLFLSCAAKFSNVDIISDVYTFFDMSLVFYPNADNQIPNDNWKVYSARIAEKNPDDKKLFVEFLKELGSTYLTDINSHVETKKMDEQSLPPFLNENFKKQLLEQNLTTLDVDFIYSNFNIKLEEESLGNQKLFEMFFPLLDVIKNGKIFICDEFERSLHPLLVKKIIEIVSRNHSGSQFIFTTHDIGLLQPELFRRDEIWFVEMKKEYRSTDLYSLAELKSIRKGEIYSRNYIMGKYFAIPIISPNIEKLLFGVSNDE